MPQVDVSASINSGQVFLWSRQGDRWLGINGRQTVSVRAGQTEFRKGGAAYDLFRMSDGYAGILDEISRDSTMRQATARYSGLRLMRQDPFQCLISFIASSNSSIPNIRRSLRLLCTAFGGRSGGAAVFPTAAALADAGTDGLLRCGLGYRAKYVREAAAMVRDGRLDLEGLRHAGYDTARDALLRVPGVGDKVADCVMLFSLEKLDAFPLDRWILRAVSRHYPGLGPDGGLTPLRYSKARRSLVEYFGPRAGYAQQFLFKMVREESHGSW